MERLVGKDRGVASMAFATGLPASGTAMDSGTLPTVAETSDVAVGLEAAFSFSLLPELAGCVPGADSAGWALSRPFAVGLAAVCRAAPDAVRQAGIPARDTAKDNIVALAAEPPWGALPCRKDSAAPLKRVKVAGDPV
jgi:hypothetical protein